MSYAHSDTYIYIHTYTHAYVTYPSTNAHFSITIKSKTTKVEGRTSSQYAVVTHHSTRLHDSQRHNTHTLEGSLAGGSP